MAKLSGPLFSFGAHGSIGQSLTFSQRKSGSQVRFQKKQKDADSTDQGTQRGYFTEAIEYWHTLDATEQGDWNDFIENW